MNITNIREMSCFGLRRSGNHGIINWIIRQNNDAYVHLNNVKLYSNRDPYQSFAEINLGRINPLVYHKGILKARRFTKYLINRQVEYRYGGDRPELDRERLRRYSVKPLLIHSYEHYDLGHVIGDSFEAKRTEYLGKSQERFDVIILRDPYNTFASLIRKGETLANPQSIINKWIEHAKEYLGVSKHFKHPVGINYNFWFTDQSYRQELAKKLGLPFTDAGIDTVPFVGEGSSFDKGAYDGQASQMPVLSRYKSYLEHPVMLKVLAHAELNELANEIFGPIL